MILILQNSSVQAIHFFLKCTSLTHSISTGRQGECGQRGGAVRGQGGAARSQRAARQGPE